MNTIHNKENDVRNPTKLSTRKSYSILTPNSRVTNSDSLSISKSGKLGKQKRERIISESTGLAKFSLSPGRKPVSENQDVLRGKKLSAAISKNMISVSALFGKDEKDYNVTETNMLEEQLLEAYDTKQKQLIFLEKRVMETKDDLLILSERLESMKGSQKNSPNHLTAPKKLDFESLRKKASTIFQTNVPIASAITLPARTEIIPKSSDTITSYLNKFHEQLKSANLSNVKIKEEVSTFLSKQSNDIDILTNKASKSVSDLLVNFTLKDSTKHSKDDIADSSFDIENWDKSFIHDAHYNDSSTLYDVDRKESIGSQIDIDDYISDEE